MNCSEMKNLIEAYIEGDLSPQERKEMQEHLDSCSSCREEFKNCRKMEIILSEAFTFSQSGSDAAAAVLAKTSNISAKSAGNFVFGKIAAGLLLVFGIAIGFYTGRQTQLQPIVRAAEIDYRISELEGTVLVRHPNASAWMPLTAESKIYAGDQLLSTPGGRVRLQVAADSFVNLFENSMLVLNVSEDQTDLCLVHGKLDADLDSPHGPFFVTTPHGRAEALGTEFTVNVE